MFLIYCFLSGFAYTAFVILLPLKKLLNYSIFSQKNHLK